MRWQSDTGDMIVHYTRASRTFSVKKCSKADKEFNSKGFGLNSKAEQAGAEETMYASTS